MCAYGAALDGEEEDDDDEEGGLKRGKSTRGKPRAFSRHRRRALRS